MPETNIAPTANVNMLQSHTNKGLLQYVQGPAKSSKIVPNPLESFMTYDKP